MFTVSDHFQALYTNRHSSGMVSFLDLPIEVHLCIISHLNLPDLEDIDPQDPPEEYFCPSCSCWHKETRNDLSSLRSTNLFFNEIFRTYPNTIHDSIARNCLTYDSGIINFIAAESMTDVHYSMLHPLFQRTDLERFWTWGGKFYWGVGGWSHNFEPLPTDTRVFGFEKTKALCLFRKYLVGPYIELLRKYHQPRKVLSPSELRRIEIAINNCFLVIKHFHSLKLVERRRRVIPGELTDRNVAFLDIANKPVIEDTVHGLQAQPEDRRNVFDFQGFVEEFSIEEHMHMAAVMDLLDLVRGPIARRNRRSLARGYNQYSMIVDFASLLHGDPIKMNSLLAWALYSRCASVDANRNGNKRFNMIARHSLFDEGQEALREYLTERLPGRVFASGLQGECLQKVSPILGSGKSLEMAPYDGEQMISVEGNINVFGKDCRNRMERRNLLIPNYTIYGGRFPLNNLCYFAPGYHISKRA